MTGILNLDDIVANLIEMGFDADTANSDAYAALYGETDFDM